MRPNPVITVIEIVLLATGLLGFAAGIAAIVNALPRSNENWKLIGAFIVASPSFIIGAIGLAGFGVMQAIDHARKEHTSLLERIAGSKARD